MPGGAETCDANDTCLRRYADRAILRHRPRISNYVAGYFASQTGRLANLPTRSASATRFRPSDEQSAAIRASAHADTPTTTHFDALGRTFLTWRATAFLCAGHALDGPRRLLLYVRRTRHRGQPARRARRLTRMVPSGTICWSRCRRGIRARHAGKPDSST